MASKQSKMEARIAALKTEVEALPSGAAKGAGYEFGQGFENSNHNNH